MQPTQASVWLRDNRTPPGRRQRDLSADRAAAMARPLPLDASATVGDRVGTRLRRVLLGWQAPQPCPAQRAMRLTRATSGPRPLRESLRRAPAYPAPTGRRVCPGHVSRGASRPQKPRPTGPPAGEWSGRAEWMRRGRVLGGPAVRAACGGNLSLTCLPAAWYGRRVKHAFLSDGYSELDDAQVPTHYAGTR
jgi:hypothetical protein